MKTSTKLSKNCRRAKPPTINGHTDRRSNVLPALDGTKLHIRSILVPIDFSTPCIKALKYAAAFAYQFGAKLTLLNVIEPVATPDFEGSFPLVIEREKRFKTCDEQLRGLAKKHEINPNLIEKALIRTGSPYNEITEAARTLKADLIVIATQGHTGLARLFLGSTAERVVRYAPCPVFVVREKEREIL